MGCESPTPPYGIRWSVYHARINSRSPTCCGEGYVLYGRDNMCFVSTMAETSTYFRTIYYGIKPVPTRMCEQSAIDLPFREKPFREQDQ